LQALKTIPAYIGAWPKPGLIELVPVLGKNLAIPNADGYSRVIGGLWRWQDETFSLLSFKRSILEAAIPQIVVVETNDQAQGRLRVANLQQTQMASWVNQEWYERGWKSSHANARLLDTVHQQLKVPAEECLDVTQELLDVRLQCPLGGEYKLDPLQRAGSPTQSLGWWVSTAWSNSDLDGNGKPQVAGGYQAPWIDWFRGGEVRLTQGTNSLAMVGEVRLEMQPLSIQVEGPESSVLPQMNFDLFSLPKQIFGSSAEDQSHKREKF